MLRQLLHLIFKTIDRLAWLVFWLVGLGLLAWLVLRWRPGDSFWPVRLVNYATPWLLLGLGPGLAFAGLTRRRRLAVVLLVPTLFIVTTYAPLFLPRTSPVQAGQQPPLRVMSYNIWGGNENIAAAHQLIVAQQPDLLFLQEVSLGISRELFPRLSTLYGTQAPFILYDRQSEQAIVSRYPLHLTETSYRKGRVLKAIVDLPSGPTAVWNVHPFQPFPWELHFRQIQTLAEEITAVEGPLIVAGDFNTTEQAEPYRLISRSLHNAHWEAGWGFGFSFPSADRQFKDHTPIPSLVRIDHIFFNDRFYALRAGTLNRSGGSDHYPIVAELVPAGQP